MTRTLTGILLFICYSCANRLARTVTIGELALNLPKGYQLQKLQGIETLPGRIVGPNGDTLEWEYGDPRYLYKFSDLIPVVFPITEKSYIDSLEHHGWNPHETLPTDDDRVFSKYPEVDREQLTYCKSYFMYDTINGIAVKAVKPKRMNQGAFGLYIPELKDSSGFSIYIRNPDAKTYKNVEKLFGSIRYKDQLIKTSNR